MLTMPIPPGYKRRAVSNSNLTVQTWQMPYVAYRTALVRPIFMPME